MIDAHPPQFRQASHTPSDGRRLSLEGGYPSNRFGLRVLVVDEPTKTVAGTGSLGGVSTPVKGLFTRVEPVIVHVKSWGCLT